MLPPDSRVHCLAPLLKPIRRSAPACASLVSPCGQGCHKCIGLMRGVYRSANDVVKKLSLSLRLLRTAFKINKHRPLCGRSVPAQGTASTHSLIDRMRHSLYSATTSMQQTYHRKRIRGYTTTPRAYRLPERGGVGRIWWSAHSATLPPPLTRRRNPASTV